MYKTDVTEQHIREYANRPAPKYIDTITTFNRDIFWYTGETSTSPRKPVTFKDHRAAIETAVNLYKVKYPHEIALCILTTRFFKSYRYNTFGNSDSFNDNYGFLIRKISSIFNVKTGNIHRINVNDKLKNYTEPTLVQINYISGDVKSIKLPTDKLTLNEWAIKLQEGAPISTIYAVAGLSLDGL